MMIAMIQSVEMKLRTESTTQDWLRQIIMRAILNMSRQIENIANTDNIAVRSGYHCAYLSHHTYGTEKSGAVRVSPGWFSTKKDIKNLVFSLNKIAKRNNL